MKLEITRNKEEKRNLCFFFWILLCLFLLINPAREAKTCSHQSYGQDNKDGRSYDAGGHWLYCNLCGYAPRYWSPHSFQIFRTEREATCTTSGRLYRECAACWYGEVIDTGTSDHTASSAYQYDSSQHWNTCTVCGTKLNVTNHSLSAWKQSKTEHWKECTTGCGATSLQKASHTDANIDGFCDECNFMVAIPAAATISDAVIVKEGQEASFSISITRGTTPITLQWYYNTTDSTSGGVPISGATADTLAFTTDKTMNNRYYYCAMSNPAGTQYSPTAHLTVYYTFTLGTQPQSVNLKKGESTTFQVGIGTRGNPDSYTYQWYIASSATAAGSRISGATSSTYSVTPTKNIHEEYYYCVVSNGKYEVISNRAKLVADITDPVVKIGTFDENIIINNKVTLKIPIIVTDTGEGYTENGSNFTEADVIVKVGGVAPSSLNKTLTLKTQSSGTYEYELTLTNINGNGTLSIEIPANSLEDNFHNKNAGITYTTKSTIDNTAPVIAFESITSGINGKYANAEDTLLIRLTITEAVGINTNTFDASDVVVKIGGVNANADLSKTVSYVGKTGYIYTYQLAITNIKGDGSLSLTIPAGKIEDLGKNPNVETNLNVTNGEGQIIIDNTLPVITSLVTTLNGYNTTDVYPTVIAAKHNGWAKQDIYVQITATDNEEIDYYEKSINGTNFSRMSSYQEVIADSINSEETNLGQGQIIYRVVDKAGNVSIQVGRLIKLDKIVPDKPVISLTEQRENGIPYLFDSSVPSTKTIFVKPDITTIVDKGDVQSGIDKDALEQTSYTITRYSRIDKEEKLSEITYAYNESQLLRSSGYYEIVMTMTDFAGNQIVSDVFKVYIEKRAENTIRVKNISDIGSGVVKATINIYKCDASGTVTSEKAITPIEIDNPYREIVQNVRLGEGTFHVEVKLEDKVGNYKILTKKIVNKL